MKKKILIEGMSCGHCVNHVKGALEELGAKDVTVDLKSKSAVINTEKLIEDSVIKNAIEEVGYDVISIEAE